MRWWARLLVGVLAGVAVCGGAAAQTAQVRIVQGGDGALYLLKDGARYAIAVDPIEDEELGAYADGGTLGGAELVAALSGPASATARSATSDAAGVTNPDAATDSASTSDGSASSDGQAAAPANPSGGAAKTSASGAGQQPATTQPATGPGVSRAGVPNLNFIKAQGAPPGGTATVSVVTTPGFSCTLVYRTPAGNQSSASGLGQKSADANGVATWSWLIDGNTTTGLGRINVNCGNLGITDVLQIGSIDPAKR